MFNNIINDFNYLVIKMVINDNFKRKVIEKYNGDKQRIVNIEVNDHLHHHEFILRHIC